MITIDDREVTQHPELATVYETWRIKVAVARLNSADYAFLDRKGEPVGIERCEIGNLIQKLRNGELESQLIRCNEDYNTVILLVEGVYDSLGGLLTHYRKGDKTFYRSRIEPYTRYNDIKALMVRLSELGIELMETATFDCSMSLIETIYRQRNKPEEQHSMFKRLRPLSIPVKLSANPAVPRLLAICPRMSEKKYLKFFRQRKINVMLFSLYSWSEGSDTRTCGSWLRGSHCVRCNAYIFSH